MEKLTGFIITAGHLDIEWYQPLRSYRFWTAEAFKELIRIYKARNGFKTYCLDGQYYPLKEYLDVVPEDEPTVREMIQDGLLSIGPFYTQFDEWLPSAESIIRNCLYGDRLCKKFGGYMRAGYLPDNFGHPMQMPQILKGFDIDSILFMRGMPEIPGGHNDEFLYKGLDGTQIFASHFRESYVKEQNIQFSAFKKCYDRDGYILRLYENQGRHTKAKVEISGVFTKAYLAKMNEQAVEEIPITNGEIVLEFAPYKALTIKLVCS